MFGENGPSDGGGWAKNAAPVRNSAQRLGTLLYDVGCLGLTANRGRAISRGAAMRFAFSGSQARAIILVAIAVGVIGFLELGGYNPRFGMWSAIMVGKTILGLPYRWVLIMCVIALTHCQKIGLQLSSSGSSNSRSQQCGGRVMAAAREAATGSNSRGSASGGRRIGSPIN
jgi:hypothetical protein